MHPAMKQNNLKWDVILAVMKLYWEFWVIHILIILLGYINPTFSIYEGKTKYMVGRLVSSNNNKINYNMELLRYFKSKVYITNATFTHKI